MLEKTRNIATAPPISTVERLAMTQKIIDEHKRLPVAKKSREQWDAEARAANPPTLAQAKQMLEYIIQDNYDELHEVNPGLLGYIWNQIQFVGKFLDSLDESK